MLRELVCGEVLFVVELHVECAVGRNDRIRKTVLVARDRIVGPLGLGLRWACTTALTSSASSWNVQYTGLRPEISTAASSSGRRPPISRAWSATRRSSTLGAESLKDDVDVPEVRAGGIVVDGNPLFVEEVLLRRHIGTDAAGDDRVLPHDRARWRRGVRTERAAANMTLPRVHTGANWPHTNERLANTIWLCCKSKPGAGSPPPSEPSERELAVEPCVAAVRREEESRRHLQNRGVTHEQI